MPSFAEYPDRPLPEYILGADRVEVCVTGKVLDMGFATILSRNKDLSLEEIILLDKVQKRKPLTDAEIAYLRTRKLIEGRKPNVYFSLSVAQKIQRRAEYTKNKGLDKQYYLDLVRNALTQHGHMERTEIDDLLLSKLPDHLDTKQKKVKVSNLLTQLRKRGVIRNHGSDSKSRWMLCAADGASAQPSGTKRAIKKR